MTALTRRELTGLLGAVVAAEFIPINAVAEAVRALPDENRLHGISIDADRPHVNLREIHDQLFPTALPGDTVRLFVPRGVTIGPPPSGLSPIEVGSWPDGVQVELDIDGALAVWRPVTTAQSAQRSSAGYGGGGNSIHGVYRSDKKTPEA